MNGGDIQIIQIVQFFVLQLGLMVVYRRNRLLDTRFEYKDLLGRTFFKTHLELITPLTAAANPSVDRAGESNCIEVTHVTPFLAIIRPVLMHREEALTELNWGAHRSDDWSVVNERRKTHVLFGCPFKWA